MSLQAERPAPAEGRAPLGTGAQRLAARRPRVAWREHRALLGLVAAGLLVRVVVQVLYDPSVFQWVDAARLVRSGSWASAFSDFWMPAGYAAFAVVVRAISDDVAFTIFVQHLLGVGTAVLLYAAVLRLGAPRWAALLPAALVLLGGDVLYAEHLLMTEALYLFVAALGVFLVAGAAREPRRLRPWVLAGVALAAVGLVRTTGLALPVITAAWVLLALPAARRVRLRSAGAILGAAAATVGAYLALAATVGGWAGLFDMGGTNLYSRVAPFADCTRFDPPAGTEGFCESTPVPQRPGPFYYSWDPGSPVNRAFGGQPSPDSSEAAAPFARAALLAQPLDYGRHVLRDLLRYVDPFVGRERPYAGNAPDVVLFSYRDLGTEGMVKGSLDPAYDGLEVDVDAPQLLETYQRTTRLGSLGVLLLAGLALTGVAAGRGAARRGALLVGALAFGLYLTPVLSLSYEYRYGIPPSALLAAAAGLGAVALVARRAGGRATAA